MSEKHLTELPWKMLAVKHKVKDNGLQKALLLYGKVDAAKEPAKAVECLADIADFAGKLKKANPDNKEIVTYLNEILKEAANSKQTIATLPKPKPAAEEAKEEEDGPDIKSRLVNCLKKLKIPDAEPLAFVACVAKPFYGVLLARSASEKIGP